MPGWLGPEGGFRRRDSLADLTFHNPELSEAMYRKFADFIYQQSGIHLGDNKQELVKTRFSKRIRSLGLKSFEE